MRVHDLAERGSMAPHVVRYYTKRGLLRPRRNADNGYREYTESDLCRLGFIRRAKAIGLTLRDISRILHDVDNGVVPCSNVRHLVEVRLEQIDEKVAELQRQRARIRKALEAWREIPDEPRGYQGLCQLIDSVGLED